MSIFRQSRGLLYPSHSNAAAAARNKPSLQYGPYIINRPSDVRPLDFAKFSQAISEAVPEANVALSNADSIQMTWKDGKPARMRRFKDLPKNPTGRLHSLVVEGPWYEDEERELTHTALGFDNLGTLVYEDVNGRKDGKLGMIFTLLQPSNKRKTTRDPGSVVNKFGRGWAITTYTPEANMDTTLSIPPETPSVPSTSDMQG
jgi:hypothetical protein